MTPPPAQLWVFRARVHRLIDGDTIDVILDCGLTTYRTERLRLLGVDTPETRGPSRPAGLASTEYVRAWLSAADLGDWPLIVQTHKSDSFGRYLGMVWRASDGQCLNDCLLSAGMAVEYEG